MPKKDKKKQKPRKIKVDLMAGVKRPKPINFRPPGTYHTKEKIKFGKDGKPFYIAGPHDNARFIMSKLKQTAGEGNYHFLVTTDDF